VNAIERGMFVAAIDVTSGDGIAIFPPISENGWDVSDAFFAVAIGKRLESFIDVPTVIFAAANDGNFFNTILSDVADPQIVRQRIKTESPWFAKTVSPDFRPHIGPVAKWIIRRDGVGQAEVNVVDINAQHFAEQDAQVLA